MTCHYMASSCPGFLRAAALEELHERLESGCADMMLDSFGVGARHAVGHAERFEKRQNDFVAMPGLLGKPSAGVGQKNRAIRPRGDEPFALKAADRAAHG